MRGALARAVAALGAVICACAGAPLQGDDNVALGDEDDNVALHNEDDFAHRQKEAQEYLSRFGYLPPDGNSALVEHRGDGQEDGLSPLADAVADFQDFAGLRVTGVVDEDTLRLMRQPRCGVGDAGALGGVRRNQQRRRRRRRRRRFAKQGSKWASTTLTYRLDGGPAAARSPLAAAAAAWSSASALSIRPAPAGRKATMRVRFARRAHGDGRAFDGPGGVLAHAFFPSSGGAVHLDGDETWDMEAGDAGGAGGAGGAGEQRTKARRKAAGVARKEDPVHVSVTAAHEMGHSLGLDHSRVRGALMSPFYPSDAGPQPKLHADDIKGIQALYGAPAKSGALLAAGQRTTRSRRHLELRRLNVRIPVQRIPGRRRDST